MSLPKKKSNSTFPSIPDGFLPSRKFLHIPEFTKILVIGTPTFTSAPASAKKLLESLGYQVLLLEDYVEAVQLLKKDKSFSLVLCAVAQAGKDAGIAILEKISSLNLEVPVTIGQVKLSLNFVDFMIQPLFLAIQKAFPKLECCSQWLKQNRAYWAQLAAEPPLPQVDEGELNKLITKKKLKEAAASKVAIKTKNFEFERIKQDTFLPKLAHRNSFST